VTLSNSIDTISYGAFSKTALKQFTIPASVTFVDEAAFYYCTDLQTITIPKGVTTLGDFVLWDCFSLKEIIVDEDNPNFKAVDGNLYSKDGTVLIQYALGKAEKSFTIPDGVTTIGISAFESSSLTQIVIPESVTYITKWAFLECAGLTEITIPKNVTFIGDYALAQCYSLAQITVDEDNPNYKSIDGNLYTKDGTTLIQYAIGKTDSVFVVPEFVTKINFDVFDRCNYVTSIGEDAFYECENLKSVYYLGTSAEWEKIEIDSSNEALDDATIYCYSKTKPTDNGNYWHYDADGETPVVWDLDDEYYYLSFKLLENDTYEVVCWNIEILPEEITIPKTYNGKAVTSIGEKAFYRSKNLKKVTLPDTITTLGFGSFARCVNLTEITIPDSVVTICDSAFYTCESLAEVTLPNSVTTIEDYAFGCCYSLTQIVIPDSVTTMGVYVFYECTGLTQATLSNKITTIPYGTFSWCSGLKAIVIPDSVTILDEFAFYACSSLTEISIHKNITYIDTSNFVECTGLKNISVDVDNPNYKSVDGNLYTKDGTTLVEYASGKTDTSFTIPSGVTTIALAAFYEAVNLTQITIPDSVTIIDEWGFTHCKGLTEISISKYVTVIGDRALANCTNLTQIIVDEDNPNYKSIDGNLYTKDGTTLIQYAIGKTDSVFVVPEFVTKINFDVFDRCNYLTGVVIGTGVTSIGEDSFYECENFKSIYYLGTSAEWAQIEIDSSNEALDEATVYYYSSTQPTEEGNYWHYNADGETPVVW
jgi:hypothetical protein